MEKNFHLKKKELNRDQKADQKEEIYYKNPFL